METVKAAIATLEAELPKNTAEDITKQEEKRLLSLIAEGEKQYKIVIEQIAAVINQFAPFVPSRRERFQHVGLFGYSRGDKGIKLPRAITFTAVLYSLGLPPEFIGTGRTLAYAQKTNQLEILHKHYVNLRKDLLQAGRFINKENLKQLAKASSVWKEVLEDIQLTEKYLGVTFAPVTEKEKRHHSLTKKIVHGLETPETVSALIKQAAVIRKSLG